MRLGTFAGPHFVFELGFVGVAVVWAGFHLNPKRSAERKNLTQRRRGAQRYTEK
jgi:hypothetical protein